jgi:PAS domain-containing protein
VPDERGCLVDMNPAAERLLGWTAADTFVRRDGTLLPVGYVSSPVIVQDTIVGAVPRLLDVLTRRDPRGRVSAR